MVRTETLDQGRTPRGEAGVRVRVAARVRPLVPLETTGPRRQANCVDISGPLISVGQHCFTFDHVFGPEATQEEVYEDCIEPLVDAAFDGVNATLLAYGQTGSGKTFTMGTSGLPSVPDGAVQRAVRDIFSRAKEKWAEGPSEIRASYIEIYTSSSSKNGKASEEVRDLLTPGRSRVLASVRECGQGQIKMEGVEEHDVRDEQEALRLLALGSMTRATACTRMNDSSSRSHAIFSLEIRQHRVVSGVPSTLTAKFHFVDLAGSEKVKVSGVEGEQLSQAININYGLFVLGKVITALSEGRNHVPVRESTLTRILQNSLGGNSRTCMLACVSPSDMSLAESLSTLNYAAKTKEIMNKPVVNQGSSCPNCSILQARIAAIGAENVPPAIPARSPFLHMDGFREAELEQENVYLRKENARLTQELKVSQAKFGHSSGFADVSSHMSSSISTACESAPPLDEVELRSRLETAQASSELNKALFRRCSEKLADLQRAVQDGEVPHFGSLEDSLLDSTADLLECEEFSPMKSLSVSSSHAHFDSKEDAQLLSLEREAARKRRLVEQVEQNRHDMAVLEARSEERLRQYEAARDLAERELARLETELEAARNTQEQFVALESRYDSKVQALKEKNSILEKEQAEIRRLRTIQRRQTTRLQVLQDSIRQVTEHRDRLQQQLEQETRLRKLDEVKARKERSAAQGKIQSLTARVSTLEQSPHRSSMSSRASMSSPAAESANMDVWQQLLHTAGETAQRQRQLTQAQSDLDDLQAQVDGVFAQRERLKVEAEVAEEVDGAALDVLNAELEGLTAAIEYHREKVWMLSRELETTSTPDVSIAAIALAEDMEFGEVVDGLAWLCKKVVRQNDELCMARQLREQHLAERAGEKAVLSDCQRQAVEQEQAFDSARSDYECRVGYLLSRMHDEGRLNPMDTIGEDAVTFLRRRVAELEESLDLERRESQQQGSRKIEQDLELIARCQSQASEMKDLRSQLAETSESAKRAESRTALAEAQLLQRISNLEAQLKQAPRETTASWGFEEIDEFLHVTGLGEDARNELLKDLRSDVEFLCSQKLKEHQQWRREMEERNARLREELQALETLLGQDGEPPLPGPTNLIEGARCLEESIRSLMCLKASRSAEFADLESRIKALSLRLDIPCEVLPSQLASDTLSSGVIEQVRGRLNTLETLEKERKVFAAESLSRLKNLWALLGVRVPDELNVQETAMLQGDLPISESAMYALEAREAQLVSQRHDLEREIAALQDELEKWRQHLALFGLIVPEDPALPLISRVESLQSAVRNAESIAIDFVQHERLSLSALYQSAKLPNIPGILGALGAAISVPQELDVLLCHYERTSAQREEHQRISDLITSREHLEAEMREFDIDAGDPDRFKRRRYSGVEENRRRVEYQRRLRTLDSTLLASSKEWQRREEMPVHVNGKEYVGAVICQPERTHMYAWTDTQLAQKEASQTGTTFEPPERRRGLNTKGSITNLPSSVPTATGGLGQRAGALPMKSPRCVSGASTPSSRRPVVTTEKGASQRKDALGGTT